MYRSSVIWSCNKQQQGGPKFGVVLGVSISFKPKQIYRILGSQNFSVNEIDSPRISSHTFDSDFVTILSTY